MTGTTLPGSIPSVTLNTGATMPQVGFGVFQVPDAETHAAVATALEAGYRSIDTATVYGNEAGVGSAIKESGIARDDLFVTTKLWNSDQGREEPLAAIDRSLELLGLDAVDLYLIHWPAPGRGAYQAAWQALEEIHASGRAKAIGVSNFLPEHLDALTALGGTVPAVNQIELHPALQQRDAVARNQALGIVTEAWSPLAQAAVLTDPAVTSIAERLGRTPAQVVLRWHLQHGRVVIPKSVTPSRIKENLDVAGFELTDADLVSIDALESDGRIGPHPNELDG
ncbi:aldo/keto reductase [Nocardioides alkalitolerans]|uniref:aldo/keto reductase n=1 Tax=Nocardioides alkalitolerans TaxID=281714 RepID=UPI00040C6E76|nr:aldo/keto reductase [Nocardioides alkalitolerans]